MTGIISKATRHLLLPSNGKLKTMWPQAKTLDHYGQQLMLIPHTPREQIALQAAGVDVPPPILSYYDWEGCKPFASQKATAALCSSNRRAYVLNQFGTGKTRAVLWAWRFLNRQDCAGKCLVVAPLSTLKFTWLAEAFKAVPGVEARVLHGTPKERMKALNDPKAQIFVINHDGLARCKDLEQEIWKRKDIDTLIIDELACYRNDSIRSRRMRTFAQRFHWVWGLTGSPMPRAVTDVWGQCKIITPGTCPKSFRYARAVLMDQVDMYRWVPQERAMGWMKPHIRVALEDVIELPEAVYQNMSVEMTDSHKAQYDRFARECALQVESHQITAANAGAQMMKLLQIAGGWVYDNLGKTVPVDSSPRKNLLVELIDEAPHKVLVFSQWRHQIDALAALLAEEEIDHAIIHGDVGINQRTEIFEDFQSTERYRVILAHPVAMAHGITLTAASTCIWYGPTLSLETWEQANARIRRPTQQHKQLYLCIEGSPVERKVYRMLKQKQLYQDTFLEMLRQTDENEA
jgi:SNF2 family DNA or RNA helicase